MNNNHKTLIEREPKLINRDRDYIFNYFSPLIHNYREGILWTKHTL